MAFPEDLLSALNQPPEQALKTLRARFPNVALDASQMNSEAHAKAFTIAKVTELDVLQTVFRGIEAAVANGTGYDVFKKLTTEYLKKTGWWSDDNADAKQGKITPQRLKLIYKTNTDHAIAAGRWQQALANKEARPYLQYRIDQLGVSAKHRDEHVALDSKVFAIDDPIWAIIYPPRGFGCNCGTVSVSQAYVDRKGILVESSDGKIKEVEIADTSTGEVRTAKGVTIKSADGTERTIVPPRAFEEHVGESGLVGLDEVFINKLRSTGTPAFQQSMIEQFVKSKERQAEYEQWIDRTLDTTNKLNNSKRTVGFLDADVEQHSKENGVTPVTRTIVIYDTYARKLATKERGQKSSDLENLSVDELKALPELLLHPDQIWYDTKNESYLYIKLSSPKSVRIAVNINLGKKKETTFNVIRHGTKATLKQFIDAKNRHVKIK